MERIRPIPILDRACFHSQPLNELYGSIDISAHQEKSLLWRLMIHKVMTMTRATPRRSNCAPSMDMVKAESSNQLWYCGVFPTQANAFSARKSTKNTKKNWRNAFIYFQAKPNANIIPSRASWTQNSHWGTCPVDARQIIIGSVEMLRVTIQAITTSTWFLAGIGEGRSEFIEGAYCV